ncbi:MAG: alpha/beta fold hydrolase [Comamonas sp.]|nr:alpha/beta fold hydrolase [Comamonas sp.]
MIAQTEKLTLDGMVGPLEALRNRPAQQPPQGVAVVAHPHPLYGGSMHNKVVQTLTRAFVQAGWEVVRFNFRGVGASVGEHDGGRGELQDLLAVVQQVAPGGNLALAGFSFGAFVTTHAVQALWTPERLQKIVLVGTAASRFDPATLPPESHDRTLVLHGEQDDTVPLASVMDWARPQVLPVTVVPGGEHFFHGQLPLLKSLVLRHLLSAPV